MNKVRTFFLDSAEKYTIGKEKVSHLLGKTFTCEKELTLSVFSGKSNFFKISEKRNKNGVVN